MRLADATEKGYRYWLRRWDDAGCPDPEAWVDGLPPGSARNARTALRWAHPDMALEPREQSCHVRRAPTMTGLSRSGNFRAGSFANGRRAVPPSSEGDDAHVAEGSAMSPGDRMGGDLGFEPG
jgi:hypothetical protein